MKFKVLLMASIITTLSSTAQYTKLHDFNSFDSGAYPYYATPITDGVYLYGTASNGGLNFDGTIYRIKKDGTEFTKLLDFDENVNGYVPKSSLILIDDFLYGTTEFGGENNEGTVYRIKTDGSEFSTLVSFTNAVNGRNPRGSLFYDGTYIYGVTTSGGANLGGTIYKCLPDGSDLQVVFPFSNDMTTGRSGNSHLISDGEYFYGMTASGGELNQGVVFRVLPDGTGYENLLEFNDDPYGTVAYGGLVYDGVEYMYGMTNTGGEYNRGTIFKIKTDGSGYVKLRDFNNSDGAQPMGTLIIVDNIIYGMTELAGNDAHGNMFSIGLDGSNFTTIIDFDGITGSLPIASLLYDNGAFYGFTNSGGANSSGVIFRYGDLIDGVNENKTNELSIYPSPVMDYFIINTNPNTAIEIYNATGTLVSSIIANSSQSRVSVEELSSGVYVVKTSNGGEVKTGRVVID